MRLYTFSDFSVPFIFTSLGWAIEGIEYVDSSIKVKNYDYLDLKNRRIETDSDDCVVFFEIGNPQHCGLTTKDLKTWFPNSKFVAFCSDTEYYRQNNSSWQLQDPHDIDLFIDVNPPCVEHFRSNGFEACYIPWTISRRLYKGLRKLVEENGSKTTKSIDFIGVYHPCSFGGGYRKDMKEYIERAGYTFTQGGGTGHDDQKLDNVYTSYMKSWITVGTTSHNRPELTKLGTQKGWRDAVGIALNSVLVYDDHPNVDLCWDLGKCMKRYPYGDFRELLRICDFYKYNPVQYLKDLKKQRKWLESHLMDDLLYDKMKEYGIL